MTVVRLPRLPVLAAGIAAVLASAGAWAAEEPPPAPASASAGPYRDRVIAADQLQVLPPEDEDEPVNTQGLPRSFHAEVNLSHTKRGDEIFNERGVSAGGFWETATLGSFSLDGNVFHSNRERFEGDAGLGGAATLWQRNLHLGGGWRGDNGLGVLNTPSLPLQRSQYRFYLPTVPFAGASSEWQNDRTGLRLQGAYGRAGNYTGTRVLGFDAANGHVGTLGAQWNWAPQWTGAAAFLGTQGRIVPDDLGEAVFEPADTQALHAATAWGGARDSVQLNLLASDGDDGRASGGWLDASALRGRYTHNYGAYRLGRDLSWGALPINNDVQGGYYRLAYQYGRWLWNGGIDSVHSISGDGFDGRYATGFVRYQASSSLGYGGSLSVRDSSADLSHSAQLFADKRTDWGQTRVQLEQAHDTGGDSWQVSLDQAFPLQQGARLSTSVAYGELADDGDGDGTNGTNGTNGTTETLTLAAYGARDLGDHVTLDGSARWTHGTGPNAFRSTDLNLGVNWRIHPRWTLATNVYQSQGSRRSPFIIDPLVTETPFISIPRDRSVFLTLRYERHAGRPQAVIGGAPGAAVGGVSGTLYLDDNNDGTRAASEQPAANITVVLDGRYSVRSDSQGNFAFPRVAVGAHTLSVVPDNLPLPWSFDDAAAQQTLEVTVRQNARVEIGARRPR